MDIPPPTGIRDFRPSATTSCHHCQSVEGVLEQKYPKVGLVAHRVREHVISRPAKKYPTVIGRIVGIEMAMKFIILVKGLSTSRWVAVSLPPRPMRQAQSRVLCDTIPRRPPSGLERQHQVSANPPKIHVHVHGLVGFLTEGFLDKDIALLRLHFRRRAIHVHV